MREGGAGSVDLRVEFEEFVEGPAGGGGSSGSCERETEIETEAHIAGSERHGGGEEHGRFGRTILLQEHVAERAEDFRIASEFRLPGSEQREALLGEVGRTPAIAGGDVGEAEVAGVRRAGPPWLQGDRRRRA